MLRGINTNVKVMALLGLFPACDVLRFLSFPILIRAKRGDVGQSEIRKVHLAGEATGVVCFVLFD